MLAIQRLLIFVPAIYLTVVSQIVSMNCQEKRIFLVILMRPKTFLLSLFQALRDFRSARSGNVAVIFALASVPLICMVGAAIDFGRANVIKVKMQSAVDSVALLLSKEAATENYFSSLFNSSETKNITVKTTYSNSSGTTVALDTTADVPTSILSLLGINSIKVGASSMAKWGSVKLRVALVLDNTGSMAQKNKMDALKTAATNFLSQLKSGASKDGDIYVSIIPFSTSVNVGSTNYNESWLSWADYGTCSNVGWGDYYTQALCKLAKGKWSAYSSTKKSSWTGCVTDRGGTNGPTGQNYDTNVSPPASSSSSKYPAVDYSACPQEAMGLSYNWSTMSSLINGMSPNGNTNQNIGLQLGWMSLIGGGPFTVPATDPNFTYQNIIVLFTDGLNTQDRWYSNQSSIDDRQKLTCQNVKADNIILYTVQISTDGTASSQLLKDCASGTTKYFYLTSESELVTTFSTIGSNLTNLRIAE